MKANKRTITYEYGDEIIDFKPLARLLAEEYLKSIYGDSFKLDTSLDSDEKSVPENAVNHV
jgi:hypothetical protein